MIRESIKNLLKESMEELWKEKALPVFAIGKITIETPSNKEFGDYSTNILIQTNKKSSLETAEKLKEKCQRANFIEKIEIAGPGFLNFFISKECLEKEVKEILKRKENYGNINIGKGEKINIEFISANPTGPLHIGNARGGFCGDVLANILDKAGHKAFKEYYINNMGKQVEVLKDTLDGKEGYKNEYTDYLIKKGEKDPEKAVEYIRKEIEKTILAMGIKYDKWFYESDLFKSKETEEVQKKLDKKGLLEEKENALWFKSTEFGDDKDRVLIKEDGKPTYLLSDIAYLENKFKRGFKKLVIFLGAEHHGYIGRINAGAEAFGHKKEDVVPVIMQLVRLVENGKEVKMSKRTGIYITIDELIKEVGMDVSRFFFLLRSYGNHLDFDLDLAKEQSSKNPVFYVQYAYARICSILRKSEIKPSKDILLTEEAEKELVKQLIKLPEVIEDTALDYQVQRLPKYAIELAESFHHFYQKCQVISDDKKLTKRRLALISATKIVLENTLDLIGVSAPEKM